MSHDADRFASRELRGVLVLTAVVVVLISGAAWAVSGSARQQVVPLVAVGTNAPAVTAPSPAAVPAVPAPVGGQPAADVPTSAVIANFNLYGCTESAPSWPSCTDRFPAQWDYINRYHLSIVGLQELEPGPFHLFEAKVDAPASGWAMFPRNPTFVHQQTTAVVWRTDQWREVAAEEFLIPKYSWRDGAGLHTLAAHEAAVLLSSPTGRRLWVLSVHNMSGENASFASGLAQDESIESQEFARRAGTGVPVVLLGDFNDDTNQAICAVMSGTSSARSIWGPVPPGGCAQPSTTKGQPFDKIIASGGVSWAHSGIDWSSQSQKLTDHGIAWADAVVR